MTNKTILSWLDGLEGMLAAEAAVSGLFEHGTMIGQAREFLVSRVLRSVLPSSVHIGTGRVIDHSGGVSKQIDVIIYDPRFPMMKLDSGGLYFVEGVLATIEVKSTINTAVLEGSLDNCKSVLELDPYGEHPEEAKQQISFWAKKGNITEAQAEHRFWYRFKPATYVFAFNSSLSLETTTTAVSNWWSKLKFAHSPHFPLLPRLIVSGNVVGIVDDGRIQLNASDGKIHTVALFKSEKQFRWLALHLMDVVSTRLGLRNYAERFDYRLSDYYPFEEYIAGIKSDALFIDITQTPTVSLTNP